MTVTKDSVNRFRDFAHHRLSAHPQELSWDELMIEWQSFCERDAVNADIQEGLDDVQAGRHQPADEVMRELRDEFGFAE